MIERLSEYIDESEHPHIHAAAKEMTDSYVFMPSVSRAAVIGGAALVDEAVVEIKTRIAERKSSKTGPVSDHEID